MSLSDKNMDRPDVIVALVTGANRGIGLETCRQLARRGLSVILTARNSSLGEAAAAELRNEGLAVSFRRLDVTDEASINSLKESVEEEFGRLDVLINNAGTGARGDASVSEVKVEALRQALETNCFGALRVTQALLPLLKKSGGGRIVNVSSGMGALNSMGGGLAAYRVSKTCLNAVTAALASELEGSNVIANAMCPGWVKTRMGGPQATRPVKEGADTAVWLALDAPADIRGKFLRDRQVIPW